MDTAFLIALSAAFILGVEHAFEPDHVAAVSTIATQGRGFFRALLAGSLWGVGHTATLLTFGILAVYLRLQFPTTVSNMFETIVGIMLMLLGAHVLIILNKNKIHFHVHSHDGKTHAHIHSHKETPSHHHAHLPISIGAIHGLAGSGALIVLTMSTMADVTQAAFFITAFGTGSILAMSMIGAAIHLPVNLAGKLRPLVQSVMSASAGILSLTLGAFMIVGFFL